MRASGRLLATATLGFALAVPTAAPADAVATNQVFAIPASGNFSFAGHGYGHGHGMSQYGAEGAARKGLTARQIVSFYYPGTKLSTTKVKIRVLISSDTTRDVKIRAQRGLRVIDRGSGKTYKLRAIKGVRRWRLAVKSGHSIVQYLTKHWHRYRLRGQRKRLVGDGEFHSTSGPMSLVTPSGIIRLRGNLRAASIPGAKPRERETVNVLSIDKYVQGVVPSEMPTSWHAAAVRSQAIAARTYAMYERTHTRAYDRSRPYDICDTTMCQVYGGVSAETSGGNAAVKATAGRYLTWKGAPAFTQFSASNGGWMAAGSFPYLPAKADPYDGWSGNPYHDWARSASASVLESRYPALGTLKTITITARAGGGEWGGYVDSVKLTGSSGKVVTATGDDIRAAYGLPSRWFMPQSASLVTKRAAADLPAPAAWMRSAGF